MNTENNPLEDKQLFDCLHPEIAKKLHLKTIVWTSFYLEGGAVALLASHLLKNSHQTLSIAALSAGIVMLAWGVYKIACCSKREIYLPSGSEIKKKTLFFDSKQTSLLQEYIHSGNFTPSTLVHTVSNGCIKMEIIRSVDRKFAGVQLLEFEPYYYKPVTPIYYYKGEQAESLYRFVEMVALKNN